MNEIDAHDLERARRLGFEPVAWAPCPRSDDGSINPQVTRFLLADGRWADVVHVKPVYYQHASGGWRPLSEVCEHHGNREIWLRPDRVSWVHPAFLVWLMRRQRLLGRELRIGAPGYSGVQPRHLAFAASLAAYPDPNPETVTVDGEIQYYAAFATAQPAASGDFALPSDIRMRARAGATGIWRSIMLFNTSAIGSLASALSGIVSLFESGLGIQDNDADGDDWINILQSNPASNTDLVAGDYSKVGDAITNPTEGATRRLLSSLSGGANNDWTLNSTGNGWINATGVTKLGFREGHDCINSAAVATNQFGAFCADQGGTVNDPTLTVTYTLPYVPIFSRAGHLTYLRQ